MQRLSLVVNILEFIDIVVVVIELIWSRESGDGNSKLSQFMLFFSLLIDLSLGVLSLLKIIYNVYYCNIRYYIYMLNNV